MVDSTHAGTGVCYDGTGLVEFQASVISFIATCSGPGPINRGPSSRRWHLTPRAMNQSGSSDGFHERSSGRVRRPSPTGRTLTRRRSDAATAAVLHRRSGWSMENVWAFVKPACRMGNSADATNEVPAWTSSSPQGGHRVDGLSSRELEKRGRPVKREGINVFEDAPFRTPGRNGG